MTPSSSRSAAALAFLKALALVLFNAAYTAAQSDVVNVGILHSQTGTLAISEISVIQAELLAIDEINAAGGVLGKRIVPVIRDGASDAATFARRAQELVSNSSIINVFGCWTSASRKAVKPIFEASKIMLWYPVHPSYISDHYTKVANPSLCKPIQSIIYSGAAPNQQLEPAVRWLLNTYPDYPFFLLGSDYVFPRTANAIIKAMLNTLGRPNVAERYCVLPKDAADQAANSLVIDKVIEDMQRLMPNGGIVFNTLNGDANVDFFTKLNNSGLRPDKYPTLSVSISETEVSAIGVSKLIGHFASWNYFMTDPFKTPVTDADYLSRNFIQNFWKKYNDTSLLLNDPMEAAYINVHMWALAVEKAQSFEADKVRAAAYNMRFDAPEGTVNLRSNHHFAKYVRIGRLASSGRFDVVFETQVPVQPEPWNQYIDETRGFVCDHRQNNGSMFKPPSINAVLLYRSSVNFILDTQLTAIEYVNVNRNGLAGRRIVSTIINLDWPQSQIVSALSNMTRTSGVDVVFGTSLTPETWTKWTAAWSAVKAASATPLVDPITYIPPDYQPPCAKNIVYLGLSPRQLIRAGLNYIKEQSISGLIYIGEDGAMSAAIYNELNATRPAMLPNTTFLGRCDIAGTSNPNSGVTTACLNNVRNLVAATSSKSRVAVLTSVSTQNPAFSSIFSTINQITAQRPQKIIVMTTSAVEKNRLTANMTGILSIASYFSDLALPENAVFVNLVKALYGPTFDPSEASEKMFSAIASIYSMGVMASGGSRDADRVRIKAWGSYMGPGGPFTVNKNNELSLTPRIAQVINVGGYLKYRLVYGDSDENNFPIDPTVGEGISADEECYFGPVIEIPSSTDTLRVITCVIAIACIIFFLGSALWVFIYRDMLVIRHSGAHFLILCLFGCTINVVYIFVILPTTKTPGLCIAEFWPLHAGFIIVFAGLLQKVYTIFQTTQRRRFLKTQGNAKETFWKQVSAACFVFLFYMILRSVLQKDDIKVYREDIVEGVRIREVSACKGGVWEWSILGVEVLMVVIGIAMALQIRDVPSAFNESFHLGMAIYIWAFIKILNEVFLLFLPFNYNMYFAMKAAGEIIPSLHTALMFLWPKFVAVWQGKGNEHVKTGATSYETSQTNTRGGSRSMTGGGGAPQRSKTTTKMVGARSLGASTVATDKTSEKTPALPPMPNIRGTTSADEGSESEVE
ncbi:hypothetical protein HDU96_010091 [Phlyctochytrium bullatum]|nr:hypothetical protein HDU96_010091 [Phlyctochytrium bullatum]